MAVLPSEPSVDITRIIALDMYGTTTPDQLLTTDHLSEDVRPLPNTVDDALRQMMIAAPTFEEREAAARAVLEVPPAGYRLRIAEWGVWLNDGSEMKLVQAVLDEIPPFVHRIGNLSSEFEPRINQMMDTKPVVHLTADVPLAVDLQIQMRLGRPWFAYPKPDDFNLSVGASGTRASQTMTARPVDPDFLEHLELPGAPALADLREGYPWLNPSHRTYGPGSGTMTMVSMVSAIGLRWQSLIVTPTRLPWMRLAAVPGDSRFEWWERLREVPCSWVDSRGEAERFVYYDGPTRAPSPVHVESTGNSLRFLVRPFPGLWANYTDESPVDPLVDVAYRRGDFFEGIWQNGPRPRDQRSGMIVDVAGTDLTAAAVPIPITDAVVPLPERDLHGPAVFAAFGTLLKNAGLNEAEASGMIDCWKPMFFQKPGRRFLLLLSAADYDAFCPIYVRPSPTTMIRVGVVFTELP